MSSTARAAENFELANQFYVSDYNRLKSNGDREGIAKFIYNRFFERYLTPLANIPQGKKSGFCMMAIACLMIEALQSFREGREHNIERGASEECFLNFFKHNQLFSPLTAYAHDFYVNIRCGILHQAETTGGWRIRRDKNDPIFNAAFLVVNADAFLKALEKSLQDYCDELKTENLNSKLWENAIKKIDAICDNCKRHSRRTNRLQTGVG